MLPVEYEEICRELGMKHLQVSYGQTEASPCIAISDYEDSLELKSHTSGRPIPDIEFAIQQSDATRNESVEGCRKDVCGRYAGICGRNIFPASNNHFFHSSGYMKTSILIHITKIPCVQPSIRIHSRLCLRQAQPADRKG